jgi:hypothetical protein
MLTISQAGIFRFSRMPARRWPVAKTIPRGMAIAKKFGQEFLPRPSA